MEFIDLGYKNYREVWDMQLQLQQDAIDKKLEKQTVPGKVLLVEHPHVYTLGRNGNENNLLVNALQLQANNTEIIRIDRGGDITYHGPGQVVVYPIIDLESFNLRLKDYIHNLEEVVIKTIGQYGIKGERLNGATGVWIEKDTPRARKICAIGVKCSRYITMHGLALNVHTDLRYFNYINPCGFVDKGVTSIEKETAEPISFDEVKQLIINNFITVFDSE